MNKIQLKNIADQVGNSFFVYEKEEVKSVYGKLRSSLNEKGVIAFSIKSNYAPSVIKDLDSLGSWFEVSSQEEYDYLEFLGVDLKKVVVNSPVSALPFLIKCFNKGSVFNIQNEQQWQECIKVVKSAPKKEIHIGIRLNLGYKSRFGLSREYLNTVLQDLKKFKNLKILALHVHVCEGQRSVKSFQEKFELLKETAKYFDNLEYLNIGGGFYSLMPDFLEEQFNEEIPRMESYLALLKVLSSNTEYKLMLEPGGFLVSNSMKFYTKALSIDRQSHNAFIQVDGSVYDIQPTKSAKQLPYRVITESKKSIKGSVVGFTCMEDDVLIDEYSEKIEVGDWIEFTNVGAYSQTLRPAFISSWKPIISLQNENVKVLRGKAEKLILFKQWL